jgi:metal transporter CNNM
MMSGLTVGYLSIDDLVLELRSSTGTDEEKQYAEKVLPILANRHWLLVTLLLMNAFAMEYLPLFLDKVVPEYLAIIISVTLVLLFGEVIPQAICTGPDQVKIAFLVAPFTRVLMLASSPISYPIAKLLDYLLGSHHKSRFLNNDLKALIELHTFNSLNQMNISNDEHTTHDSSNKMGLYDEQANLMISALEIREKKVIELMIPIKNSFMIDYDEVLDKFKLQLILDKGYSRIPVYSNHNSSDIVGLLRIKNLIGVDFNQNKTLRQLGLELKKPLVISPRLSLIDLLREFREGRSHMAFITEQVEELQQKYGLNKLNSVILKDNIGFGKKNSEIKILGIITLEDIIEKMINLDILDEDDYEKITRQKRKPSNPNNKISNYLIFNKTISRCCY